jgi:hypothetical protein
MTTVAACRPLLYRAHEGAVLDKHRKIEQSIELLIGLAHDYDDPDAYRAIRGLRPDLSDADIRAAVDRLLDLSDAAYDACLTGAPSHVLHAAIDEYEAALRNFAEDGSR